MGSVGPDLETVYQAGCDMTEFFLDKGARKHRDHVWRCCFWQPTSSGKNLGNAEHSGRKAGLVLDEDAEKLSATDKVTELTDKDGNLHVTICPDIPRVERDLTIWRPHLRKVNVTPS